MVPIEVDTDLRIWQVVAMIPRGRISTYGDIARFAGMPGAARRVGRALRRLPGDTRIPWHRVVNASGRISLPAGSDGHLIQMQRLKEEGIRFDSTRITALYSVRWDPA